MDENLINLWQGYQAKLDQALILNKYLVNEMLKKKLNRTVGRMIWPKGRLIVLAVPYIFLLCAVSVIAILAKAVFVAVGFGVIAILNAGLLITYLYHIYLIRKIQNTEDLVSVQEKLAALKISSYHCARVAVLQLPFWVICWISWEALKDSPIIYGGVNLLVCLTLGYISYKLYKGLDLQSGNAKIQEFFLSGEQWDPIVKSYGMLEEIRSLKE